MQPRPGPETLARLQLAAGWVFDLDGSLVLGDKRNRGIRALPGACDTLELLQSRNVPYVILTNGTVKTPAEIAARLQHAGLPVATEQVLTPATVAAEYFVRRGFRRVLVLGIEGVWKPLEEAGLEVILPATGAVRAASVDAVFVGWYREFHMDHIEAACEAVWAGAGIYGASMVPFFATREGRALGSSRAICAMIRSVTGKHAVAIGKPSRTAMNSAVRHLGCRAADTVVVGDDPDLEVAMARRAGALAVAVNSGVGVHDDFASLPAERRPQVIVDSTQELHALLAGLA